MITYAIIWLNYELKNSGVSSTAQKEKVKYFAGFTNINYISIVASKDLAQKVQDYLVTTSPSGSVTPYATFSKSKSKELSAQARAEAEKDARSKAEKSAKNLGFKLGEVKSISESNGGGIEPLMEKGDSSTDLSAPVPSSAIAVQPGQEDTNYQISVIYYIK
jgi:hypothetical protein